MTRDDMIEFLWESVKDRLFITHEQHVSGLAEWDLSPIVMGEEFLGVAMRRGPEYHFTLAGKRVAIPRRMVDEEFRPQIEKYGYVETRTPKSETRQRRFNEAFGFVKIGEDDLDIHYRYDGRRQCRQ